MFKHFLETCKSRIPIRFSYTDMYHKLFHLSFSFCRVLQRHSLNLILTQNTYHNDCWQLSYSLYNYFISYKKNQLKNAFGIYLTCTYIFWQSLHSCSLFSVSHTDVKIGLSPPSIFIIKPQGPLNLLWNKASNIWTLQNSSNYLWLICSNDYC